MKRYLQLFDLFYTESTNNAIKKIEKAGRGYKFDTLRERCLLEINHPKPNKFDPRSATYIQTVSAVPSEARQMDKVKKLYAPKAKPEYKDDSLFSIPEGIMQDMTTFNYAVSIKPKCVYKTYNGKLGDYLTVYLEMHDSRHREESFQNRMKMYYSRLKELNL